MAGQTERRTLSLSGRGISCQAPLNPECRHGERLGGLSEARPDYKMALRFSEPKLSAKIPRPHPLCQRSMEKVHGLKQLSPRPLCAETISRLGRNADLDHELVARPGFEFPNANLQEPARANVLTSSDRNPPYDNNQASVDDTSYLSYTTSELSS